MVATVSRGALRFIGGQISHNSGAEIRTPSASLGIRGGMATVVVQLSPAIAQRLQQLTGFSGATLVVDNFGQTTVTNNNGSSNTLQAGLSMLIGADGSMSSPFRLPDDLLRLITQLINQQSGSGGVPNPPKPGDVPTNFAVTVAPDPAAPPGTDPLGYISIFGAGNAAAGSASQTSQAGSVSSPPSPSPPPTTTCGNGC
jgi:hypothetical protein